MKKKKWEDSINTPTQLHVYLHTYTQPPISHLSLISFLSLYVLSLMCVDETAKSILFLKTSSIKISLSYNVKRYVLQMYDFVMHKCIQMHTNIAVMTQIAWCWKFEEARRLYVTNLYLHVFAIQAAEHNWHWNFIFSLCYISCVIWICVCTDQLCLCVSLHSPNH